jgi:hypothetical protein
MSEHLPEPSDEARDRPSLDRDAIGSAAAAKTHSEPLEEVVEAEAANVAEEVAETVARRRLRPLEGLMLAMLAVSLIIHVLTLTRLFSVRNTLREEIGSLADSVQAAKSNQVRYDLPIDQQIPINLDLPVKQSLTIPIQTEVRIKQDITLPIDTGFGKINIPVPIDAVVPINTTVPINIDQTVNISTSLPLKLNVPIQLDLGSPQFSGYLDRLHQKLLELRDQF